MNRKDFSQIAFALDIIFSAKLDRKITINYYWDISLLFRSSDISYYAMA